MNRLYAFGRNEFLKGQIDWIHDDIKVVLLPANYIPNTDLDEVLADIPLDKQISISQSLYNKTANAGIAGAAVTRCVDVLGADVAALSIFKDTGLASTSTLIAYIDVGGNLPITPEGADLLIAWPSGLIFKL